MSGNDVNRAANTLQGAVQRVGKAMGALEQRVAQLEKETLDKADAGQKFCDDWSEALTGFSAFLGQKSNVPEPTSTEPVTALPVASGPNAAVAAPGK